jgi:hypothetical protein
MASEVLLVQGTSIRITTNAQTTIPPVAPSYATLDCIGREITYQSGSATEIDVTTLCSTAKEFRLGLVDPGTMTVTGHWKQGNAAHTAIRNAAVDKLSRMIEVTFDDGSTFKALAFVQQRSFSAAVDGVVTATYNFRLTGTTVEDDPSGN